MKVYRITIASQILQDTCNHQAMKMTKACTGPHALTAVTIKYVPMNQYVYQIF